MVDVSEDFDGQISLSGGYILAWDEDAYGDIALRRVAWPDSQAVPTAPVRICAHRTVGALLPFFRDPVCGRDALGMHCLSEVRW